MQFGIRQLEMNGNNTPEGYRAAYERHNAHVKAIVPPENLLLWGPQDGWEPICKFLGVPVPEVPLPYINETASFKELLSGIFHRDLKDVATMMAMKALKLSVVAVGAVAVSRQLGLAGMVRGYLPLF